MIALSTNRVAAESEEEKNERLRRDNNAFEIKMEGKTLGMVFEAGADGYGALFEGWADEDTEDCFGDLYPQLARGVQLVDINGFECKFLGFASIVDAIRTVVGCACNVTLYTNTRVMY
jgi:hypothetical protein